MVFRPPFGLNNEYGRNFKVGCPPVNGGSKEVHPPPHAICGFSDPPMRSGGYLRHFPRCVKPEIVGVAGANMQWGHFVCPSSSQKRESTAFDLILQSAWGLSSSGKQVGRSSTPCPKFGVKKVNSGQNICKRDASVGEGKNLEKQAQSSKG